MIKFLLIWSSLIISFVGLFGFAALCVWLQEKHGFPIAFTVGLVVTSGFLAAAVTWG